MTFVMKFDTQSPCITGTSLTQLSLSQIVKRYVSFNITCCEELHVSKPNIRYTDISPTHKFGFG